MIRLFKVFMSEEAPDEVGKVLRSGYIGDGEKVKAFEKEIGEFIGNPRVLMLNSGTSALRLSLILAGVGHGDYVISTPMTCLATNTAILETGAKIVWADVNPSTGLIDVDDVRGIIKSFSHRPKAVMCMHWGGSSCNLSDLNHMVRPYGIPVIEDACQALGSKYGDSMIGNHSRFTCFSFQAIKTLTTGDGGAIAFRDEKDYERARLLKWFGLDRESSSDMRCKQDPPEAGYKMQSNDIAAAIGLSNIKHLPNLLERMRKNAHIYSMLDLKNVDNSNIPFDESSNWLCTVLVNDSSDFIAYMRNNGIECSKVHDRCDTKTIFSSFKTDLPGVNTFNRHHVCIPCGWWLSDNDTNKIIDALKGY